MRHLENAIKRIHSFNSRFLKFVLLAWEINIRMGAPAAMLKHGVTFRMEVKYWLWAGTQVPKSPINVMYLTCISWTTYPWDTEYMRNKDSFTQVSRYNLYWCFAIRGMLEFLMQQLEKKERINQMNKKCFVSTAWGSTPVFWLWVL